MQEWSRVEELLGHAHIPQQCAAALNEFHREHLNRYVNYHRPCLFAQVEVDERGRQRRRYRYGDVQTPYEKLKSLPDAEQNLKAGVTIETLDAFAAQYSDNEAAERLRSARKKLFFSNRRTATDSSLKEKEHRSIVPIFQLTD